jgi:hypothetical protein
VATGSPVALGWGGSSVALAARPEWSAAVLVLALTSLVSALAWE